MAGEHNNPVLTAEEVAKLLGGYSVSTIHRYTLGSTYREAVAENNDAPRIPGLIDPDKRPYTYNAADKANYPTEANQ